MNFKSKKELCGFIGGLSEFCLKNNKSFNYDTLKDYLDTLVVAEPRPFERGDRVKTTCGNGDVTKIDGEQIYVLLEDGEERHGTHHFITLITPASEREIKKGDTFWCSACGQELVCDEIKNGFPCAPIHQDGYSLLHDTPDTCTFRSRPKPEPKKEPTLLERVNNLENDMAALKAIQAKRWL